MKSLSFKSLSYFVLLDNNNYLIKICPGVGYKCCILINNASTDEGVLLNTEFWFRYYMNPFIRGNPQFSATLTKTTDLISYPNTRKKISKHPEHNILNAVLNIELISIEKMQMKTILGYAVS